MFGIRTILDRPSFRRLVRGVALALTLFAILFAVVHQIIPSGKPRYVLNLQEYGGVWACSPDGSTMATAGGPAESPICIRDLATGKVRLTTGTKGVSHLEFTPNGNILAAFNPDDTPELWDVESGQKRGTLPFDRRWSVPRDLSSYDFSPDGRFLAFEEPPRFRTTVMRIWSVLAQKELLSIETSRINWSPDSRRLAAIEWKGLDSSARASLWTLPLDQPIEKISTVPSGADAYNAIAIHPDATNVVTAQFRRHAFFGFGSTELVFWDLATGQQKLVANAGYSEASAIYSLQFVASGRILVAGLSHGGQQVLWDVTGAPQRLVQRPTLGQFSADGQWLAEWTPGTKGPTIYHYPFSQVHALLVNPRDLAYREWEFSPNGCYVAVNDLVEHPSVPRWAKWLPYFLHSALTGPDRQGARLWDTQSGKELEMFNNCQKLTFAPDSKILISHQNDATLQFWDLPLRKSLAKVLCWSLVLWLPAILVWLSFPSPLRRWKLKRPAKLASLRGEISPHPAPPF